MKIVAIGMIFKAAATAVGFIAFSKGDKKVFLFLEGIGGNLLTLVGSVIGYMMGGLNGLAIAFVIINAVFLAIICIVTYVKYEFYFSIDFVKLFSLFLLLATSVFVILFYFENFYGYLTAFVLTTFSFFISFRELNKRVEIMEIINRIKKILKK